MFASLKGKIIHFFSNSIILEVNNVGYLVNVFNISQYKPDVEYFFYIKTLVKENSIDLYGFKKYEEYLMFNEVIQISGVGPKIALNIFEKIQPEKLQFAIDSNNFGLLKGIPGIGPKLAQKITLELKGKKIINQIHSNLFFESLDVLKQLGFENELAEQILKQIITPESVDDVSVIIAKAIALRNKQDFLN